ncbi:MAG: outer membrane protein assembly factor BamE [Sulfuricellaceae bacterium]|nr:outer membrane protein assembly factor BamE [Sulfuricellaceae bacterium]
MKRLIPLLFVFLAACSFTNPLQPYKIDVQQGNVVTQDMVSKLKAGMTKSQVRYVLGTPLLMDIFHANRWDYVYRYVKAGRLTEERRLTLFFDGDKLQRVTGDVVPAGPDKAPEADKADAAAHSISEPAAPAKEKGFFGKILDKVGL